MTSKISGHPAKLAKTAEFRMKTNNLHDLAVLKDHDYWPFGGTNYYN